MEDIRDFHWTVTGSSHLSRSRNCEDASLSFSTRDYVIAAVADGHGARYCFRSGKGAKMAVETAWRSLQMFMQEARNEDLVSVLQTPSYRRQLFYKISSLIVHNWRRNVLRDLKNNPVSFLEQMENLPDTDPEEDEDAGCLLYGTTLLFAAMNEDVLLLGQQGDGRICVLYADGTINMPVPWDQRCYQNVTTSMCDADADTSMRFAWVDLREKPVAAVFLLSDGIEDSFKDFESLYAYLLEITTGYYRNRMDFERYLANSFAELSHTGSKDDASMAGFFCRLELGDIYNQIERRVRFSMDEKKLNDIRSHLARIESLMKEEEDPQKLVEFNALYNAGIDAYSQIRSDMKVIYEAMKKEEGK